MKYKKVRIDFKYCEKGRFFRTFLIKEDLNLVDLGCAFVTALEGVFEHNFVFYTKDYTYNPRAFLEYDKFDNDLLMDDYNLSDLGDKFEFTYDTGDGWDFDCKVYTKTEEINSDEEVILIDGAGQGIWEDNIHSLSEYFDGRLNPDGNNTEPDENGCCLPWNMEIEKYSDFDNYDLEEAKEFFYDMYVMERDKYKDDERRYFAGESEEEYDDEEDEDTVMENPHLQKAMLAAVDEQIVNLDYVRNTYDRLTRDYSELDAKKLIAGVLLAEIYYAEKEQRAFDEEHYKKELKIIK